MIASRLLAAVAALTAAVALAGCGTTPAPPVSAAAASAPPPPSLATSLATAGGTWAEVVMGGSVARHDNFWQLFARPAGASRWNLVTPPGTADNGGLILAAAGPSLIAGFRPSQDLTFSPLSATSDNGRAWSSDSPLDAPLASAADALAAAPASENLLALLSDGTAMLAAPAYTSWKTLTTLRALAGTPAGRHCGLHALTAVAYTPSGLPLMAGTCARPGNAGIFADRDGVWQATGPAIPATLARRPVAVIRLTRIAGQITALLVAGSGHDATLLAAWSADSGLHWMLSPVLGLGAGGVASASFGASGTVAMITTSGSAELVPGERSPWRALPAVPPGTATLAPGPGGTTDALAVRRGTLTVWQLAPGHSSWVRTQTIVVPIQYGSSG
jgi:hypothetical protein